MSKPRKYQEIVYSVLDNRLCDLQLKTTRDDVFNYCEDIRELLIDFMNNELTKDTCEECGCNEFLCGHNKRG